ncbi:hypothetical protein [Burkholderia stagnalis]|uniref:hypothetical protein n=1 Tax=Burkholderia stagnalis TaxID=1503054 RepID=UPI000752B60D|nr:hypothetical protein [Burkholderia stagnalis]KWI43332.1 hypothetical protein WT71_27430 [Burkholderia stagnalis]KWI67219.1 hypothetical protein WT73_17565 [Burkholderia stagnalis]
MTLQLIAPQDKYMLKAGVISHDAVIGHLHQVLKSFAAKQEYSKFYIGITSNLNTRLASHRANKPDFKWMCPIYEEAGNLVENAFDRLERKAVMKFNAGIKDQSGQLLLQCSNGPGGALPKNLLYILVG